MRALRRDHSFFMKRATIVLTTTLWLGTVTAAWWHGRHSGSLARTGTLGTMGETAEGPGRPKPLTKGRPAPAVSGSGSGNSSPSGPAAAPLSLDGILGQVQSLMRTGGMQNPSSALKAITLMGQIRDEDLQEALKRTEEIKEPGSKMMLSMVLLSRWAEKDGPGALRYAEESLKDKGPMMQMAKMGVLSSWAQSDPDAAWEHIQKSDDVGADGPMGGRGMMMMGLFSSLAAQDPDKAFARLAELQDPQERQMALGGIAQSAFDDTSRNRLMDEISKLPDANERKEARAAILGQLAMMDPEKAMAATSALPAEERAEVSQRVGTSLMMSDPAVGANYLVENAAPHKKSEIYNQVISQWVGSDANAAGAWLGAQPPSQDLDQARASFATRVANRDPESAMAWAGQISDETQRTETMGQVFKGWQMKDPAAANSALTSSGLSQENIQSILTKQASETDPE